MVMNLWKGAAASLGLMLITGNAPASDQGAPTLSDLANATYKGLSTGDPSITLKDGEWRGEPFVEGGATMPWAELVGDLVVQADLDGDGQDESINLVQYSGGGTGHFVHLVVSRFSGNEVEVLATALIGDRVMVRDIRADEGIIAVDVVQAGEGDGACCPGEMVTRAWRLESGELVEQTVAGDSMRLSPAALAGWEWRLEKWSVDEAVDEDIEITLAWSDGRLAGRAACNRYFAGVRSGEGAASSLVVEGVGSTRMACSDERLAAAESRFLGLLEQVNRMYFLAGDLVLYWGEGEAYGALYFKRASSTES